MYDAKRNVTARATTNALLWAVNRAEFKSILTRHLSGSLTAQVWMKFFLQFCRQDIVGMSSFQSFACGGFFNII